MNEFNITGSVYAPGRFINLYHLNELYRGVASVVSEEIKTEKGLEIDPTSGIWGGTYLIADNRGVAKNKIHRLYCIVNLPRECGLEDPANMDL